MLEGSLLGKLYIYWENSVVFRILAAIVHAFGRAWECSLTRRIVLHKSRIQKLYEGGLISRIIDWIIHFILKVLGAICRFFAPAWKSSKLIGLASGSLILRFEFMLGAWIALMFALPHTMWSNSFAVAAAAGLFLLYIALIAAEKKSFVYPKELGAAFLVFVAITVISILFSAARRDSFRTMLFFAAAFIFMWLVASEYSTPEKLEKLLGWIYLIVMFTAAYAVLQRLTGLEVNPTFIDEQLNPDIPARVYSTVENPNNYAELLVLFAPLAMVYAMTRRKVFDRFVLCILMPLPAIAMLMTYSRAGWLSIALAVLIFVYYTNRKLLPWIFVLAIFAIPFLPASIMTRLANLLNPKDSSASFRIKLWGYCLELLRDSNRWLTGIGLGSQTVHRNLALVAPKIIADGMPHTQMLYIELVMEWGLFGFLSYMWFIIGRIKNGAVALYRTDNKLVKGSLVAAISALVGIAVLCIFEYIWFYPRILFAYFIVLGILLSATKMVGEGR